MFCDSFMLLLVFRACSFFLLNSTYCRDNASLFTHVHVLERSWGQARLLHRWGLPSTTEALFILFRKGQTSGLLPVFGSSKEKMLWAFLFFVGACFTSLEQVTISIIDVSWGRYMFNFIIVEAGYDLSSKWKYFACARPCIWPLNIMGYSPGDHWAWLGVASLK